MKCWTGLTVLVGLASILAACAPQVAPTVAPTLTPVTTAPAPAPAVSRSAPSSEEGTWARVVAEAKKEGLVTVYGSSQFAGPKGRESAQAFQRRYGIRVEMMIMPGRQIAEKVGVEKRVKQPIGDVAATGTSSNMELSIAGLLEKIWKELPELKDKSLFKLDPVFNPSGDVIIMSMYLTGPMVNTKLVRPDEEPRSYSDFLNPRWKNRITLTDPRGGGAGGFMWFSVMRAFGVLDDSYFRRFNEQEPNLFGGSTTEEHMMIARGEYALTPLAGTDTAGFIIVEGAPLKILGMKEGNIVQGAAISMIKEAAHPNAARLFVNWILSQEGHTAYVRAASVESMRKDVSDFLDPRVELKPPPQKLLPRTYEIAEMTTQFHKDKIAEAIFSKK